MSDIPVALKVGTTGKYTLKKPWMANPDMVYKCYRIGTINDHITELHVDVLNDVYIANGLSENEYKIALDEGIRLVTLSGYKIDPITVPENYILNYPDSNYIPYPRSIITVDLGLIPHDIPIKELMEAIQAVVSEQINIDSELKYHQTDVGKFISYGDHLEMEAARLSGITPARTLWQRVRDLEIQNDALSTAVRELEDAITNPSPLN